MADIIRLLPDSVANQIAAGEVVQRPSSVVKELLENSIDAGADRIELWLTDAGKSCIQVIDNGKGMSETDARLSFERHATSKIKEAKDLFNLHTMGFRGEALASIAAVAQVELQTRTANDEMGVSITVEGARCIDQHPVMCPVGANFAVRNLFFNVPARRRFLKSNVTEMNTMFANCSELTTINVAPGADWSGTQNTTHMFAYCTKLVGGNGTTFSSDYGNYALVDGLNGQPGYFTCKLQSYYVNPATGNDSNTGL